jgi:D-alanyl-D-alanine carboxypeptidase/D-alanyl-D-alanine-endopeptidase (penicillin-binding protein 4)
MILKSSLSLQRKNSISQKSIFLLILLLFSFSYLRSQDSLRIGTKNSYLNPINELKKDIESIINIQDFSNAFIGVCILSLETGEYIFNRNENICFIPASTNKIITTAAALDYLGSDFRYNTPVYLDGKISENGEFTGNIIIRGSGDPTFSNQFHSHCFEVFNEWTSKLDSLGIKSIRGNIIADDRYFDSNFYPPGWFYDDMLYSYSPQITALAFNDNKIDVTIKPGEKVGEQAKIITYPIGTNIFISNSITTLLLSEPSIVIPNRIERTDIIELKGGISLDSSVSKEQNISIAVEDPSIFFLNNF